MRGVSIGGIATRFAIALGLVSLSWNPSPYNFYRWATNNWETMTPIVLFVALCMLIGWVVFLRATTRSLGTVGLTLAVALAASFAWILIDFNLVDPRNSSALSWLVLVLFAAVLTAGMCWSLLRRRWSGQADVDDLDEVG